MKTSNRIVMSGNFNSIYSRAADIAQWPDLLPHYRYVNVLEQGPSVGMLSALAGEFEMRQIVSARPETPYAIAEMAARHLGYPLWWKTIQIVLPDEKRIVFRHIGGITKGMDVEWTFAPLDVGDSWCVTIHHRFTPSWPWPGRWIAEHIIGQIFVKQVADKTLQRMKFLAERDSRTTSET